MNVPQALLDTIAAQLVALTDAEIPILAPDQAFALLVLALGILRMGEAEARGIVGSPAELLAAAQDIVNGLDVETIRALLKGELQ